MPFPGRRTRISCLLGMLLSSGYASFGLTAEEPLPVTMPDALLYLELVVNGQTTKQVVPVNYEKGHYIISAEDFSQLKLPVTAPPKQPVTLDTLDNITVSYDSNNQRLLLQVPSEWLPNQEIGGDGGTPAIAKAMSSLGFIFNYDIYANQPAKRKDNGYVAAWNEQRLFGEYGTLSNTGTYRESLNAQDRKNSKQGYLRYDTQWRYDDEEKIISYTAGDLITGSLAWSSAVRMAGFQLARNFTTRPDLVTYPLPQFSGQAAIPSSVDLFINNYRASSANVDPGPFTFNTVPYINGAGEATVVTTDALGKKVTTTVPFYVANTLLKRQLFDYSLSVGTLRKDYGIRSSHYGNGAASAVARYGLTNWLTIEGRAEGTNKLAAGGTGLDVQLGHLGILNASYTRSRNSNSSESLQIDENDDANEATTVTKNGGSGDQVTFGYSYASGSFSVNASRSLRSNHFSDLSTYDQSGRYGIQRRSDQLTGSLSLGEYGSLGAGYFDVRDNANQRTRLVNLSYSFNFWKDISFYASANREIGASGMNAMLLLSMPLGSSGTVSASRTRDTENKWSNRLAYSRSVPSDGGLGVNLVYGDGTAPYRQADIAWRTQKIETRAGIYGNDGSYTHWAEALGSFVVMDSSFYATNQIGDAFVLISTDGYADIPVSYENQLIGKTDTNGHLLLPSVTSYYKANIEINPLNLPENVSVSNVNQSPVIKGKSGYLVKFPVKEVNSVSFSLLGADGNPIQKGSLVQSNGHVIAYVGWDGYVYLENSEKENTLTVIRADDNQRCQVSFTLPSTKGIQQLNAQRCINIQ